MKKTTPQKLTKRLAQYGALSFAIAGVADVNGQIVYTDVDPDEGGTNVDTFIDFDNDGNRDFLIGQRGASNLSIAPYQNAAILGNANGGPIGNYKYPFALNTSDIISAAQSFWITGNNLFQTLNVSNCYYQGSDNNQWCSVTDKYLGLRFLIGIDTHYGWARLDVGILPNSWVIKDYAYNSTPGASIMPGEGTPLSIKNNLFNTVKIVALNKSIALFNLPQQTNYRLFSITGQSVLDGKITNNTYVIEANTLASGIYIIELKDNTTNAVIRKKIVL